MKNNEGLNPDEISALKTAKEEIVELLVRGLRIASKLGKEEMAKYSEVDQQEEVFFDSKKITSFNGLKLILENYLWENHERFYRQSALNGELHTFINSKAELMYHKMNIYTEDDVDSGLEEEEAIRKNWELLKGEFFAVEQFDADNENSEDRDDNSESSSNHVEELYQSSEQPNHSRLKLVRHNSKDRRKEH